MLGLIIDAAVLILLLKTINDEDIGFGAAALIAIVAAIGTAVLAIALAMVMGIAGIIVAAVLAAWIRVCPEPDGLSIDPDMSMDITMSTGLLPRITWADAETR